MSEIVRRGGANHLLFRLSDTPIKEAVYRLPSVAGYSRAAMDAPRTEIYQYETDEQLHSIERVSKWTKNDDFSGFFMLNGFMMTRFETGMTHCIGLEIRTLEYKAKGAA